MRCSTQIAKKKRFSSCMNGTLGNSPRFLDVTIPTCSTQMWQTLPRCLDFKHFSRVAKVSSIKLSSICKSAKYSYIIKRTKTSSIAIFFGNPIRICERPFKEGLHTHVGDPHSSLDENFLMFGNVVRRLSGIVFAAGNAGKLQRIVLS